MAWQVYHPEESRQKLAKIEVTGATASEAITAKLPVPWGLGWFGVVDYDAYSGAGKSDKDDAGALARVYRSLVIDHRRESITMVSESEVPPTAIQAEDFWAWQDALASPPPAKGGQSDEEGKAGQHAGQAGLSLVASSADSDYLAQVEEVLSDIKSGRYYQINLLRYFALGGLPTPAGGPTLAPLAARFLAFFEPYSLWFRWGEGASRELVSFSPERFVAIPPVRAEDAHGDRILIAEPIKGTIGRLAEAEADERQKAQLAASRKDRAELHMIVDLLRHDMWPLCLPQTIAVRHAHRLRSFQRVHHLVATIAGTLKPELSLADCWSALLPAGSITGTPKKEVMGAISQLEGRPRGLFMGVAFHFNPHSGGLDSSVLIRSVTRSGGKISYAAGSGLVIHSDPAAELAEIYQKCRVVTDPLR